MLPREIEKERGGLGLACLGVREEIMREGERESINRKSPKKTLYRFEFKI